MMADVTWKSQSTTMTGIRMRDRAMQQLNFDQEEADVRFVE